MIKSSSDTSIDIRISGTEGYNGKATITYSNRSRHNYTQTELAVKR